MGKQKKPKSEAQKAARKKKRADKKIAAAVHGAQVLAAAKQGGYQADPKKRFVGQGDYRPRIRGQGDLVDDLANGAGSAVRKLGEWGINKIGGLVKGFLGMGDYKQSGAPAENGYVAGAFPKMLGVNGEQPFIVEHHQMITELFACKDFKVTSFHINPGLRDTLSWLAPIARQFDQWEFEAGLALYVPGVTQYTDGASGDLVFACRYDVDGIAASSIQDAVNWYLAVAGRPCDRMMMAFECAPGQTPVRVKKVRAAEVPSDDNDEQFYDHCILDIYQGGQPATSVGNSIGRLYMCYKIRFYKPIVQFNALDTPTAHYKIATATAAGGICGATADLFVPAVGNSLPLTWIDPTAFALPSYVSEGNWMVITHLENYTSGATTVPFWNLSGCTTLNIFCAAGVFDSVDAVRGPVAGATSDEGISIIAVRVTAASPSFTQATTTFTGTAKSEIFVVPLDIDLVAYHARRVMHQRSEARRQAKVAEVIRERNQWERKEEASTAAMQRQIDALLARCGLMLPPVNSGVPLDQAAKKLQKGLAEQESKERDDLFGHFEKAKTMDIDDLKINMDLYREKAAVAELKSPGLAVHYTNISREYETAMQKKLKIEEVQTRIEVMDQTADYELLGEEPPISAWQLIKRARAGLFAKLIREGVDPWEADAISIQSHPFLPPKPKNDPGPVTPGPD